MRALLRSGAVLAITLWAFTNASQADFISYQAALSGAEESPPNASPGLGDALVDIDTTAHLLHVHVNFSDLIGTVSASHIHGPTAAPGSGTAGVATMTPTFAGFPSGVTAGTYDHWFDTSMASTFNAAFVTANGGTAAGAEAALAASLAAGTAYLNIHSSAFPGGEIRGFLRLVPEPTGLALLAAGLLVMRRR